MRLVVFLCLLLSLIAGRVEAADSRYALVIGNAKYPDSESPLKEPVNDMRAVADELKRSGFEVYVGENLTSEAMKRAFTALYDKIKPGAVAMIFFSGYGIQSGRQSFMIPVDSTIWDEKDVRRDGVSLDSVLSEMNSRGASVKIAILDASRRNPYRAAVPPVLERPCTGDRPARHAGNVLGAARHGRRRRDGRPQPVRYRTAEGNPRPKHHRRRSVQPYARRRLARVEERAEFRGSRRRWPRSSRSAPRTAALPIPKSIRPRRPVRSIRATPPGRTIAIPSCDPPPLPPTPTPTPRGRRSWTIRLHRRRSTTGV